MHHNDAQHEPQACMYTFWWYVSGVRERNVAPATPLNPSSLTTHQYARSPVLETFTLDWTFGINETEQILPGKRLKEVEPELECKRTENP